MSVDRILLIAEGGTNPLGGEMECVDYPATAELGSRAAVWLDLAPRAPLMGPDGLATLVGHVRAGGGLVVSGSLGASSMAQTALGDLLPVAPVGDRDIHPSWAPSDIKPTGLSQWPGSGHVRLEAFDHPLADVLSGPAQAKVPAAVACALRPGARLVARFLAMPPMAAAAIPTPAPWPFVAEWAGAEGRVLFIATPAASLASGAGEPDGPTLARRLLDRAADAPTPGERAECGTENLAGRLRECRERIGSMGLAIAGRLGEALTPPTHALDDARRATRAMAPDAALAALENARRLTAALEAQVAEAEAEQARAAISAHDAFHAMLAELETSGSVGPWELARVEAAGLPAKDALARGYVTDALKRYRGLCESFEDRLLAGEGGVA
jgi:hypothetical protein